MLRIGEGENGTTRYDTTRQIEMGGVLRKNDFRRDQVNLQRNQKIANHTLLKTNQLPNSPSAKRNQLSA